MPLFGVAGCTCLSPSGETFSSGDGAGVASRLSPPVSTEGVSDLCKSGVCLVHCLASTSSCRPEIRRESSALFLSRFFCRGDNTDQMTSNQNDVPEQNTALSNNN